MPAPHLDPIDGRIHIPAQDIFVDILGIPELRRDDSSDGPINVEKP
jgi:hypothetical protein